MTAIKFTMPLSIKISDVQMNNSLYRIFPEFVHRDYIFRILVGLAIISFRVTSTYIMFIFDSLGL